jgi:hypothetical protein
LENKIMANGNDVLDRVKELLDLGQPREALHMIDRLKMGSPAADNACGVCLMRTGDLEPAVAALRGLAFPRGGIGFTPDTPALYQANFITALLLSGHVSQGLSLLGQIPDRDHPAAKNLRTAVSRWKQGLGFARRVLLLFGICPNAPVAFDRPPGEM